jgi:hypothetical protein
MKKNLQRSLGSVPLNKTGLSPNKCSNFRNAPALRPLTTPRRVGRSWLRSKSVGKDVDDDNPTHHYLKYIFSRIHSVTRRIVKNCSNTVAANC